jgi:predicted transcriptional regulator
MKMTVKEFATLNVITTLMADAVLKVFAKLGVITQLDSIKGGKGRPTKVYDVPETLELAFTPGKVNAKTFSEMTGVDKIAASSFLKFLKQNDCIVELESDHTGKGRPTKYFELPDSVVLSYDMSVKEENSEEELETV